MNIKKNEKQQKGRPKTFERKVVLDQALQVFCERGYQGTSMADLSEAMGLNPPSIYNSFGNKEHLFVAVLEHYHAPYRSLVQEILALDAPIQDNMLKLFRALQGQHARDQAHGCLIANSGIAVADGSTTIATTIKALHDMNERILYGGLKRAQQNGEISENVNIRKIARFINGVFQGAAVSARGQRSPKVVRDILDQGYKSFLLLARLVS